MNHELLEIERKLRLKIPKNLGLTECWSPLRPVIETDIGGGSFTAVPYLTETPLYKIGSIFVKVHGTPGCCGAMQKSYKVLGPLRKFINKSYSTPDWCVNQLPTIKTTPDFVDFKVQIGSGENEILFMGNGYHQLRLSDLMRPIENLQLNRSTHEELGSVDRFGLINYIAATKNFELRVSTKKSARIFSVGDGNYTMLFGYQICHIDQTGVVVSVVNGKPSNEQWMSLRPANQQDLPLWQPEK